jgi:hypothetical protein
LSAYVKIGPLEISLWYYDFPYDASTVGQTGEYCEIVKYATPEDYGEREQIWVNIGFDGLDWSVVEQVYFSIQVEFSVDMCPVTIDLQRTNGESMFLLQEFGTIQNPPTLLFGEHEFHLSNVNDTLYLPNGNYSLSIDWESYESSLTNVGITNESLTIKIKIKSVRLNVEPIQKIPGLVIYVGGVCYRDYPPFLLKDSPSFYLPSGNPMRIEVRGEPGNEYYPLHFSINLDTGDNRNITLQVNENWILVGGLGFTPGRLAILIASVFVMSSTLFISRKKLIFSSLYLPFILIFLASIVPSHKTTSEVWLPMTLPLYSICTETDLTSMGIDLSVSSCSGSAVVTTKTGEIPFPYISQLLFVFLLIPFIGVLYEHLRKEGDSEFPDFLIVIPIFFLFMLIQWSYVIDSLELAHLYPSPFTVSIGAGPFLASLAFILWVILYRRKGGLFFASVHN